MLEFMLDMSVVSLQWIVVCNIDLWCHIDFWSCMIILITVFIDVFLKK